MIELHKWLGRHRLSIEIDGEESIKRFTELVQRGTNLWPDAHPEIKEFADRVTVGHVQQNYQEQATDKHRNKKVCPHGYSGPCSICTPLFLKS